MDSSAAEDETEVMLQDEQGKPATTDELRKMLNDAGTELTVKYITGEMDFQEFCAEVKRRAASQKQTKIRSRPDPKPSTPSSSTLGPSTSTKEPQDTLTSNIPGFDQMLTEENYEVESEEDEEKSEADAVDFEDSGALDYSGDEWVPDQQDKKAMKSEERPTKRTLRDNDKSSLEPERRKKRKPRRRRHEIPRRLLAAQGKALLLKAQGHTEEAMKVLYEIIKKAPIAAAPFQALGTIQEELGNSREALKFHMVAANLKRAEPNDWFELVSTCMKLNEPKLAMTCYYRAMIYAKSQEAKLQVIRSKMGFFLEQDQPLNAMKCKEGSLAYMPRDKPDAILAEARGIVKDYLAMQEISSAISTLQFIHKELPKIIDAEDIHLLVELLMSQKDYQTSLDIMVNHCGVMVTFSGELTKPEEFMSLVSELTAGTVTLDNLMVPTLMPLDLRSKLVQCFLMLKSLHSLDGLQSELKSLIREDVEEYGDIHLDIAEALIEAGFREDAKPTLQTLVNSTGFCKAEVWLTYGRCLNALGEIQAASDAYTKVVEMAPDHYAARVVLSSLQQQMGHNEKALQILSKGSNEESAATSDQLLLLHKCQLLHAQGRLTEFVTSARKLLSFCMKGLHSPDFIGMVLSLKTLKKRKLMFLSSKKPSTESTVSGELRDLEKGEQKKFIEDMWDVYNKLCLSLHESGRDKELQETAIMGATCPTFCEDEVKVKDAEFLCLKMGPVNSHVYNLAKRLASENKDNNQVWNLYSYIMTKYKDLGDLRFVVRALMKNPHSPALGMLNGNARLISGTYKQALSEYLSVFRQNPDNAMAILCCALCLLHIASQSHASKRNILIPQVLCFLNVYKEMRGQCQETYYNMGKAMYQINLHFAAIKFYKKALQFPPIISDDKGTYDLRHEIAHNLACIYLSVGNVNSARYYIQAYCVI